MSLRRTVFSVLLGVVALGALAPVAAEATKPGDREVVFKLRAAKRQPLLAQGGLVVRLRCPQETCAVAVQADDRRLKPQTVELAPGATSTVKLKIRKGKRRAIRGQLLADGRLRMRVTATAIDAAGNTASAELFVKVKR